MPNRTFTWNEASARRLERSGLAGKPVAQDPAGIAAALCGAHAQVLSAAELSLMLRTDHGTRTAVQDALWCDRSLVKTYGPRGTVHLLPTAELPMWTGALSAVPAGSSPFAPDVRLTPAQTEQVLAAIEDALAGAELTVDELGEAVVAATEPSGVRLLPYFDAYGIACRPRDLLFPGRAAERALAGRQAGNFPVLLIDGTVVGVWHQRRSGRRMIQLTVEPLTPLTARQRRGLDAQVERVGEILQGTTELTIGTVSVGPHA
ncbi:hypothetical protein GTW98_24335 [Streptomyces sp. SID8375]|uniref:DNA glycosylase AlkZ-like family protein n=1 Tax=unclassified Streptomyces TaxID=2593676 RepID=UPI0003747790|nr:crosslink repair DNA glycosylase YcaQ family protein [Streptomyces sp. FxanaC1]MYX09892.1 hypothetical protein [Streptomyces sp. SID8375]